MSLPYFTNDSVNKTNRMRPSILCSEVYQKQTKKHEVNFVLYFDDVRTNFIKRTNNDNYSKVYNLHWYNSVYLIVRDSAIKIKRCYMLTTQVQPLVKFV